MAFLHGLGGSVAWTKAGTEGNTALVTSQVYYWKLVIGGTMKDVTPMSWNSDEWVRSSYRWGGEVRVYIGLENPGFLNDTIASVDLKTTAADWYRGSCWLENIAVETSIEDAIRGTFLIRGTGDITRTF